MISTQLVDAKLRSGADTLRCACWLCAPDTFESCDRPETGTTTGQKNTVVNPLHSLRYFIVGATAPPPFFWQYFRVISHRGCKKEIV